jgi:uncharacterized protein (DUF1684 family)
MTKTFLYYIKFIFHIALIIVISSCEDSNSNKLEAQYVGEIILERQVKYAELLDSTVSRFNAEEREAFSKKALQYYPPDISYNIEADFLLDTSYPVFQMPTTTDRRPNYRIYGYLNFSVKDTTCKLVVFQNYDYKDDPEHGKYVFIPFFDKTCEYTTYGGGRYIDIERPSSEKVMLDFNMAYNPYCAYSPRWSCPIVPPVNTLEVAIMAGEKSYK